MVFYKTPTSVIGPGETIIRPKGTEKLDAEAELVIVIKDRCHKLTKANAMQHVLGYTCGNDVSARDWQRSLIPMNILLLGASPFAGLMYDLNGNYIIAFETLAALNFLGAVLLLMARKPTLTTAARRTEVGQQGV